MRTVLASVIRQYLLRRYSHFFFSSELHYNDWSGSKIEHVACPPATVLPGENPLWKGKTSMQNTYSRLSPGKIGYIVIFPVRNSTISPFFRWKISLWKNHRQFSGETTRGRAGEAERKGGG